MKLLHIDCQICPSCGCEQVVAEEQKNKHTNGQWNERREFACGHVIRWSPNGNCLIQIRQCEKSSEHIVRQHKRELSIEALKQYIDELDVDDDWKRQQKAYVT